MPAAGDKKVRPLQGGIQIVGNIGSGRTMTGTLGLVIDKEDAPPYKARFVTAGHVVGDNYTTVTQGGETAGLVQANHLNDGVDIAVVNVSIGVPVEVGRVWTGDDTYITVKFAGTDRPAKGSTVVLQGSVSGNVTGTVVETNATITDATTGSVAKSVVVVDYGANPTAPRDSGAPVLSSLENGALCYGVHGGSAKIQNKIYGWFTPFDNLDW